MSQFSTLLFHLFVSFIYRAVLWISLLSFSFSGKSGATTKLIARRTGVGKITVNVYGSECHISIDGHMDACIRAEYLIQTLTRNDITGPKATQMLIEVLPLPTERKRRDRSRSRSPRREIRDRSRSPLRR